MDSSSLFMSPTDQPNSGQLPWMPIAESTRERHRWMNGWKYEDTFFSDSQQTSTYSPDDLPEHIQQKRRETLGHFVDWNDPGTEEFERQAASVDRILFAETRPEDWGRVLKKIGKAYRKGYHIEAESFHGHTVNTPMSWFIRFQRRMSESVMPSEIPVEELFQAVAVDGRLANRRPSEVAAAMVSYLIGEEQAAPYLNGYDLFDYVATMSEVVDIIDLSALTQH